jgi:hypothetical protein
MKKVEAYQCDFCTKISTSPDKIKKHELKCKYNPLNFTIEQIIGAARYVCHECGCKHGEFMSGVYSSHTGICDICGDHKELTGKSQYNYLYKYKNQYPKQ